MAALVVSGEPLDALRVALRGRASAFKVPTRWLVTEEENGAHVGLGEGRQGCPPAAARRARPRRRVPDRRLDRVRQCERVSRCRYSSVSGAEGDDDSSVDDDCGGAEASDVSMGSDVWEPCSRRPQRVHRTAVARTSDRSPIAPETTDPPGPPHQLVADRPQSTAREAVHHFERLRGIGETLRHPLEVADTFAELGQGVWQVAQPVDHSARPAVCLGQLVEQIVEKTLPLKVAPGTELSSSLPETARGPAEATGPSGRGAVEEPGQASGRVRAEVDLLKHADTGLVAHAGPYDVLHVDGRPVERLEVHECDRLPSRSRAHRGCCRAPNRGGCSRCRGCGT